MKVKNKMKKNLPDIKLRLPRGGMYLIILKRIALCKIPQKDIIPFTKINSKLGTSLQINKEQIWDLLLFFHDLGMLEIVTNHGIILNYDIINDKIKFIKNKPKV